MRDIVNGQEVPCAIDDVCLEDPELGRPPGLEVGLLQGYQGPPPQQVQARPRAHQVVHLHVQSSQSVRMAGACIRGGVHGGG